MRTILFAITGLELGGAEVQLWHHSRALRDRGWGVHVASLIGPGIIGNWLARDAIPVTSLRMRRGVASPLAVFRFARLVDETRPDLVHSHMFHANLLARAARVLRPGIPLINSSHVDERGVELQHLAYRLTAGLCSHFHSVSRGAMDRLLASRAVSAARISFIPNGIPMPAPAPSARARLRQELGLGSEFVFVSVGRLHRAKDPGNLIDAFSQVARRVRSARLLIVGSGPLETELRARIQEQGLAAAVRMLGQRSDVPDLLRAADALVIPSSSEALPLVLLEAALAGIPVVATAVGDIPKIIEADRSGLLCAPRDGVALAEQMLRLVGYSVARRSSIAATLSERVKDEYGFDTVMARWEQLYEGLIARD